MSDFDRDPHPDSPPASDPHPYSAPGAPGDDDRSDVEQAVMARSDAVARGEGGREPDTFNDAGLPDGPAGTGGVVKNQDHDQQ